MLSKWSGGRGKTRVGTHNYAAPEVNLGEKEMYNEEEYTIISDIWSTGLVFYYMLFGKDYFAEKSFKINGDPKKLKQVQKEKTGANLEFDDVINEIDESLKNLLRGMIEFDPKKRLDWKGVFNHEIFKRMNLSNSLMQALNRSYSQVDPDDDFKREAGFVNGHKELYDDPHLNSNLPPPGPPSNGGNMNYPRLNSTKHDDFMSSKTSGGLRSTERDFMFPNPSDAPPSRPVGYQEHPEKRNYEEARKVYTHNLQYIEFILKVVEACLSVLGMHEYRTTKFFLVKMAVRTHRKAELLFYKIKNSITSKVDIFQLKASFLALCEEHSANGIFLAKLDSIQTMMRSQDDILSSVATSSLDRFGFHVTVFKKNPPKDYFNENAEAVRNMAKGLEDEFLVDMILQEDLSFFANVMHNIEEVEAKQESKMKAQEISVLCFYIINGDNPAICPQGYKYDTLANNLFAYNPTQMEKHFFELNVWDPRK